MLTKEQTTAIKGFAILCMIWHHLFLYTDAYGAWAQALSILGKVCVSLFLFVSGYGLTIQYGQMERHTPKNTLGFLLKRYAKFFLAYWFCMAITMLVGNLCGYTFADAYPPQRNQLKCFLLDCCGWMGYDSYLKTWWFNKLIIQLYLIFPILFFLLKNKYVKYISLVAFIIIEQYSLCPVFAVVEGGLVAFFIGMLAATSAQEVQKSGTIASICAIAVLVAIRFAFPVIRFTIIDGFIALGVGLVVSGFGKVCNFPILRFFGQYATIMYLTHTLLHKLLHNVIYVSNFAPAIFLTLLGFSLLVAIAIAKVQELVRYKNLEQSAVRLIDRIFS